MIDGLEDLLSALHKHGVLTFSFKDGDTVITVQMGPDTSQDLVINTTVPAPGGWKISSGD